MTSPWVLNFHRFLCLEQEEDLAFLASVRANNFLTESIRNDT